MAQLTKFCYVLNKKEGLDFWVVFFKTHWEVPAVEFEFLPHVKEQVQVEMVQQQMNGHVPLPARLQEVTQQLHVTEAVHDNKQGLRTCKTKLTHKRCLLRSLMCTCMHVTLLLGLEM